MRPRLSAASLIAAGLLTASLLVGCQTGAPGDPAPSNDEITVTSLDAAAQSAAAQSAATDPTVTAAPASLGPRPKPRPDAVTAPSTLIEPPPVPAASEAAAEPAPPKSPEQRSCEKARGQWAQLGKTGVHVCVKPTRDGGKQCHKETDCQDQCLARSGTCAPITPLLGCNEILDKVGRRSTLCIN